MDRKALDEKEKDAAKLLQEENFQKILDIAGVILLVLNADQTVSLINEKGCEVLGYEYSEMIGKNWFDNFIPERDREKTRAVFAELIAGNVEPIEYFENFILAKDNSLRIIAWHNAVLRNDTGQITATLSSGEDITERKAADEAIKEAEKRYRNLFEEAPVMYVVTRHQKGKPHIIDCNDLFVRTLGYSREQILNRPITDFYTEASVVKVEKGGYRKELPGPFTEERQLVDRDGRIIETILRAIPDESAGDAETGTLAMFMDITEQKNLEDKLIQAHKMEAVGTLAGGVAHDLNNILSGIVSYPELILMDLPENSPYRKPILTIQKSGERAVTIVQDLLTLARRGVAISEVVNLNHLISEQLNSPEFGKLIAFHPQVQLETHFENNLLNVKGSTVHLSKTIMNLFSNAAEAMPDGGKITISTENRYVDRPLEGYDQIEEGDYVTVTVSDTGIGISKEDMQRIFEPFYTKKVMGRSGTGLGMAVVWGTVKDHKGYINVDSREGVGTTFILYFPVTREEALTETSAPSIETYKGRGESILVVDDVEVQRDLASMMLHKLGYSATVVSSGEAAIAYLKDNTVDLLVLDMIMEPGMDGLETYRRVIERHPNQKAIIASGFSETDRVKEAQRLGAGKYVKKPYTLEKIGLAVKAELKRSD